MNAPEPTLTSSTKASMPDAILRDMIDVASRAIDPRVAVASRNAVNLASAGTTVAGEAAKHWANEEVARQQEKFDALGRKKGDIAPLPTFDSSGETEAMLQQIDARTAHLEKLEAEVHEWQKQQAKASEADVKSRGAAIAKELRAAHGTEKAIVASVADADGKLLQGVVDALKSHFSGPIFLVGALEGRVALIASVPKELTGQFQANKLIQEIAPIVGGKGGGRSDNAQGAGKDTSKIDAALTRARELLL